MIDRKELRIGNYIQFADQLDTVNAIDEDGIIACEVLHAGRHCSDWDPIPLTEEWFAKFGFIADTKFQLTYVKEIDEYAKLSWYPPPLNSFSLEGTGIEDTSIDIRNQINYVHQLQNLFFALTGNELSTKVALRTWA